LRLEFPIHEIRSADLFLEISRPVLSGVEESCIRATNGGSTVR